MTILVQGGDEFHDECRAMDRALLDRAGDGLVVIYPGASEERNVQATADHAVAYYKSLGADVAVAEVEPTKAAAAIAPARTVVLPGGSPRRLLQALESDSGLVADALRAVLLAGGAISGSSAGAMVLGSLVWLPDANQVAPGLGLIAGLLLPHAEPTPARWLQVAPLAHAIDPQAHCLALGERSGLLLAAGEEITFGAVHRWE